MALVQDMLAKYGVKDVMDLTVDESNDLFKLLSAAKTNELSVARIKEIVRDIITSLEQELVGTDEFEYQFFGLIRYPNRQQIYLKARLHNMLFLDGILNGPEKQRKMIEEALERVNKDGNTTAAI